MHRSGKDTLLPYMFLNTRHTNWGGFLHSYPPGGGCAEPAYGPRNAEALEKETIMAIV